MRLRDDNEIIDTEYGQFHVVDVLHHSAAWKYQKNRIDKWTDWCDYLVLEGVSHSKGYGKYSILKYINKALRNNWHDVTEKEAESHKKNTLYLDVNVKYNPLGEAYSIFDINPPIFSIALLNLPINIGSIASLLGHPINSINNFVSYISEISFGNTPNEIPIFFITELGIYSYFAFDIVSHLKRFKFINKWDRSRRSLVIDYRNAVAASKSLMLAKKKKEETHRKQKFTLIYGALHKVGLDDYLSNIENLKKSLETHKKNPMTKLYNSDKVTEINYLSKDCIGSNYIEKEYKLDPNDLLNL